MVLASLAYTLQAQQERILEFQGLNKKSVIDDGEMRDMLNLSSDEYPCLYQRKPRAVYSGRYKKPTAMIVKDSKLAVISNGVFYYDGQEYGDEGQFSDKTRMVAINSKICFFPEKRWFSVCDTEDGSFGEFGNIEETLDIQASCSIDSSKVTIVSEDGDIGINFRAGDAVTLTVEKKPECNTSAVIEDVGEDYIKFPDDTFINIIAEGTSEVAVESGRITVERLCPALDYVIEANNRLWGVSNADNTIYACKLGDPTNWQYYQSTSLDSYAATQGTDGEWTGCAMYSSHLLFFKEDYIHRLFGSKPANYQTDTMECHALEKGSSRSLAIINDVVFYKSRVGIMAYSGGTPVLISDSFGTGRYENAVAGTDRFKYFVSLLHDGKPEFLVYDTNRLLWHKEDELRVRSFAYHGGKLLYIAEDNQIYEIDSDKPAATNDIKWMAQFGPFDEFIENKKVYSKFRLRVKLAEFSELIVMISVDDGKWELVERIGTEQARSLTIPVVPRRCNRFAIRLEGKGYCKVESLVRVYRQGRL